MRVSCARCRCWLGTLGSSPSPRCLHVVADVGEGWDLLGAPAIQLLLDAHTPGPTDDGNRIERVGRTICCRHRTPVLFFALGHNDGQALRKPCWAWTLLPKTLPQVFGLSMRVSRSFADRHDGEMRSVVYLARGSRGSLGTGSRCRGGTRGNGRAGRSGGDCGFSRSRSGLSPMRPTIAAASMEGDKEV